MSFGADLRHALRSIRKTPLVSVVIVVSLAIGIGVNATVFSWIQAVMLQPLPGVRKATEFYLVEPRAETGSYPGVAWLEYQDLRHRVSAFSDVIASRMVPFNVGESGHTERAYGLLVSDNYFAALGLRAAVGRFFSEDEGRRVGADPIAVISHDYWLAHFGAAADVAGRAIRVNGRLLTVIGVAPQRFQGTHLGLNFDLWVPATLAPALIGGSLELEDRSLRGYSVLGRLANGATHADARAQVDREMKTLAVEYPTTNAQLVAEVLPFWQAPRGPQRMLASALLLLQVILLLLLLTVCGNAANLLLARASAQLPDLSMRRILGSGAWRVARLILVESLVLSLMGAGLGAAIAVWATDALRAVPIITAFPIKIQTSVDPFTALFIVAIGFACGLLFGVVPAWHMLRTDPSRALRGDSRIAGGSTMRKTLMGTEVGLALVVLLAAATFLKGYTDSRNIDPGFRRDGVLLASYDFTAENADRVRVRSFTRLLLDRLRDVPQVDGAAIATSVPLDIHGLPIRAFVLDGATPHDGIEDRALANTVTPGYFKTMGIPVLRGSDFVDLADQSTPAQAVVNEEFAHRFLGNRDPIGRGLVSRDTRFVIAGVVRNSVSESFGEPLTPVLYLSYRDRPGARGEIHLRTRAGSEALLQPAVERIVRELDPTLPLYDVRTLDEHLERNLFLRRIPARMFVVLGPLLVVLAAVGVYAVVAYSVSCRTREIGVRLALGATARQIVSQMVGESFRIVVVGALVGWSLAVAVALHLVRDPMSLTTFGGTPALLLVVAATACWIPARRAARVDPMLALKRE